MSEVSIEQMVREILKACERDGIVRFCPENFHSTGSIDELTAGDLVGPANLLQTLLMRLRETR